MPVPGYDIELVDTVTPRGAPTATDTLFLVDFAEDGPLYTPTRIESPARFDAVFGDYVAYSQAQACIDAFFAIGGGVVYFVRYGGPDADEYDDDHANATNTELQAALNSLGVALGPGQLVVPGATSQSQHALEIAHEWDNNRYALLVPPAGATDEQLEALADGDIAEEGGRFAALWRDYAVVPGRIFGTTRTVPWAIVQAGLIAASDSLTHNPNREAAGKNGIATHVLSIVDEVDDIRREALRDAQVNTAKTIFGDARAYGVRTLADLSVIPHWSTTGGSRTVMAARALIAAIDEDFVFTQIDGRGQEFALYNGAVKGALEPLFSKYNALYGATLADALSVDTGPTVNTSDTIAANELRARVQLKTSPTAEHVVTFLSRVALDQSV